VFLTQRLDRPYYFAHDRQSDAPTYLSFKFPLEQSGSGPTAPRSARPAILAIDDEQVILDLIAAMCQSLEYDVTLSRSGEAGLRQLEERPFDLVLCDLSMPGLSGLEVAREIAKVRPGTPVVLVTGWQASLKKSELDAAGVTRVLSKPFRIEQLTDLVEHLAGKLS
jgi:CheY-like chemotaxis protein